MCNSSKKSDVKVAAAPAASSAVPAKKGKRDAEEALEKQATTKKQKKEEVVVPKQNFEKKSKKTVPPPKKKVETSSSDDETSSESEEENKVVHKANVDESSDESDEEPHKKKLKVQTPAPAVGKSTVKAAKKDNSSDEDEDDSSEERSDEETPKAQQSKKILAPVAGESNPKAPAVEDSSSDEDDSYEPSEESSEPSEESSDEETCEESSDEEPSKAEQQNEKTTFGLSMKQALQMLRTYHIQVPNELAPGDPAQISPAEDNVKIEEHETTTSPIVGIDVPPATEDEPNPLAILPSTPAADSTMEPSASNYARVPEYIPMLISSMAVSTALDSEPINVSSRGSTHVPQFAMIPSTKVMSDYFPAMLIKQFYTILEVSVKMIFKSKRLTFEDVKKSLTSFLEGIPSTTGAEQIASLWQLLADVEREINEWTLLQRSNVSILLEPEYQTVRDKVGHARANFNAAEQLHLENIQKLEAEQEITGARAELLAIQESSLAQERAKLEEMLERVKAQYTDVEGQRQALNEEELQLQHSLNEEHAKLAKIRNEYASLVPLTDEDIQNQLIAQAERRREARLKLLTEKIQGLTQYPF